MSPFTLTWVIRKNEQNQLIRDFLLQHHISKTTLTAIKFKGGKITVNGIEQNVRYRLQEGDQLTVTFPHEQTTVKGEDIPLQICYEDRDVLVINKPPHMNTIPSREHPSGSLANAIIGYYEKIGYEATVHVVTRLDRDTSGLVLVAKHRYVHHLFSQLQQKGKVKRTYQAFVEGTLKTKKGTIEAPIGRKDTSIIEREVREDGQYACTHYEVIAEKRTASHVQLRLETGRTHQIRVHMSYLGHPLLGDELYGGSRKYIHRQALHCSELSFYHPLKEDILSFRAPIPEDMLKAWKECE
jgi:23S rRNA pseudouridine1911/1915/1917 synthase